ncbi:hypothetical protein RWE15_08000 [Virgibacillus halophilus]|uniref:Uncharacterized protein n=2 Tax=Tigheibacillus halophilus TaxID=361280 RepID=A0ABU5C763_9BACI|nr:hypothetical protein [Virgibacillus halophilus]
MIVLNIEQEAASDTLLPACKIDIDESQVKSIYSDVDLQAGLAGALQKNTDVTFF